MTKGFGQQKEIKKAPSEGSKKRLEAAKQMDAMKAKGLPEFEIYIRVKDTKSWFPVGGIAVQRTNQVDAAIYANEENLRQGAFRIFPVLKKNAQNLEYGYRNKEFKDDPIALAVKPAPGVQGAVQAIVSNLSESVTGLFKKKKK
jgi:Family of unknown function (DUF6523)